MKPINNYNEVEATEGGSFERLAAGGYVCQLMMAEDKTDKEYLQINYDIAEGKYKGWWAQTMERAGFWGGHFTRSYKDTAKAFFKGFTTSVEQSNKGYAWNWEESTLVNKFIGLVLAEEEYNKNDGTIGTRLYVAKNTSVDKIRSGDFKVPDIKKLTTTATTSAFSSVDSSNDGELPWKN